MSERKTNNVTTPSGTEVAMREFISAGEFLDLDDAMENGAELSPKAKAKRLMLLAVVSIAGSTENLSERLRELPVSDYLFLAQEVSKLVKADFIEAKNQPK